MFGWIIRRFRRFPYVLRLFMFASSILLIFGSIIHFLEPNRFPTVFDGVWWAIITASTIGYGDYVPSTIAGRIFGILLVIIGVGFVSSYFAALAATTVKKQNSLMKGTMKVNVDRHFIVIGWNERSREIIYHSLKKNPDKPVILVDASLEKNPLEKEMNLYFIHGEPYSEDILRKANIKRAEVVLITANAEKKEIEADMQTILTIITIKGLAPNIYCIAEILTSDQIANAKRAGADEVIPTNQFTSSLMFQTMYNHGISKALLDFVSQLQEANLDLLESHPYSGQVFGKVQSLLLNEKKILIGLIRGQKTIMNPSPTEWIQPGDQLLFIEESKGKET